MCRSVLRALILSSICGFILSFQLNAVAEVKIEFGSSGAEIRRTLIANGYSEVKVVKQSLGVTTLEGCLGSIRYRLKILFTGDTKWRIKVGTCREKIDIDRARAILIKQGYSRIDIESRRNAFVAIACQNRGRLRVTVDQFGDVRQERRLGRCRRNALSPTDIKADLARQGYTRIRFTDRQLPRYVAEACRGLTRVELVISSDGDVRQENDLGRCRRAIDPRDLVKIMRDSGFDRIKVIDDQLPQYVVEACRQNRRSELTLDRFGSIVDQYNLGECALRVDRHQLLKLVKSRKLTRAKVISQNNGIYIVDLCDGASRKHVTYNIFGELIRQKEIGVCNSRTVLDVSNAFANRKISDLEFFAEGCRKGRKIRIEFNNIGDPVGRKNLGKC